MRKPFRAKSLQSLSKQLSSGKLESVKTGPHNCGGDRANDPGSRRDRLRAGARLKLLTKAQLGRILSQLHPDPITRNVSKTQMLQAVAMYRANFKPSAQLSQPHVMLGFNVFAADTDEEGAFLATSMQQAFVNLRSGHPSRLQPPMAGYADRLDPTARAMLDQVLSCTAIGSPDTVRTAMNNFIERTGADELMITSQMFDHAARLRSYEIVAEVRGVKAV